jgi:RNA polymerase sigma factor (TIGR02999 family)
MMTDVTRILNAIEQGDSSATEKLLPLVYEELRLLAAQKMSQEKPGQTLQATALVHEAYIRLVEADNQNWDNRRHFFAAAAEAMRRILVENARHKQRLKHGRDYQRIELNDMIQTSHQDSEDLIALDEALTKLVRNDSIKADLVKLHYFSGLSLEQVADILQISRATAYRYWSYAQAWLFDEINRGDR